MKVCSSCDNDYNEEFKFCPECGHAFGGDQAKEMKAKLNQHLFDMKRQASNEAALTRRVTSGAGLGDSTVGRVFGTTQEGYSDM